MSLFSPSAKTMSHTSVTHQVLAMGQSPSSKI